MTILDHIAGQPLAEEDALELLVIVATATSRETRLTAAAELAEALGYDRGEFFDDVVRMTREQR